MKRNLTFGTFLLPALLLLLITSCKKEGSRETATSNLESPTNKAAKGADNSMESKMLTTELLKSVHSATARYHSTTQAIKAGYMPDNNCVSAPGLGGMGYHWVNTSLIDPVFDPLTPEVMLYAPGPGGKLRLVAVEYLVINAGQPRPMFDNQLFDIGSGAPIPVPHWSLHVWVHEENPSGMFKPFNPNISCP